MNKIVVPIRTWLYVASIIIVCFSSILLYADWKYPDVNNLSEPYIESLKSAIISNNTKDGRKVSVVIFGSSLSSGAFSDIDMFEKKMSVNGKSIKVLRVSMSNLNMEKAKKSKFFDYIREFPPDYLFLESNNLFFNRVQKVPFSGIDAVRVFMRDMSYTITKQLGFRQTTNIDLKKMDWFVADKFFSDKFDSTSFKNNLLARRNVNKFSYNEIINQAFSKLLNKKTKIILLTLPNCSVAERAFLKRSKGEFDHLINIYQKLYGINCWAYPNTLSDHDFIDGLHLNYKGSEKYFNWFCAKFNSIK